MSVPDGCMLAGNSCSNLRGLAIQREQRRLLSCPSKCQKRRFRPEIRFRRIWDICQFVVFPVWGQLAPISSARMSSPQLLQYQTGIGVANSRCRLITQSQSSAFAQSIRRFFMKSGYQAISLAVFSTASVEPWFS